MRELRAQLAASDAVSTVDLAFADFLVSQTNDPTVGLYAGAVLASAALQNGDVCCDLHAAREESFAAHLPGLAAWREQLLRSGLVQAPEAPLISPLILDQRDRLYLARYWRDEQRLAAALLDRVDSEHLALPPPSRATLDRLFPPDQSSTEPDWQRVATLVATQHALCVITGGPGTGKTRTVARLLAVLQQQSEAALDIALLAPTGKAAARLLASLQREAESLRQSAPDLTLPDEASTVHRKLGYRFARRGFVHNAHNPLRADVVLVDEASMIDLFLMARLVEALRPEARLILLGDRDQLASVEAGNVLGDIVGTASAAHYSAAQRSMLASRCDGIEDVPEALPSGGLADAIVSLRHSYRFDAHSRIGRLARAVNAGDGDNARSVIAQSDDRELQHTSPDTIAAAELVVERALPQMRAVLAARSAAEALAALDSHRILCALRDGPRGVEAVNQAIEQAIARAGLIRPGDLWYRGRPLLITRNAPSTGLYNGDTGVIWPDAAGQPLAWFTGSDGLQAVAPGRLPAHQTSYAMTVHKSQGSEFERVLLLLPEAPHSVLSRELVYTGITRARRGVELYGSIASLRAGCEARRVRVSGLRDWLWGSQSTK